jgi:enolase
MIQMAELMASEYGFVIIEDPLHENDFEGHRIVTKRTGVQIVGDDLFATNALRVMRGASEGAANAV